jgi:hypothetical protein
VDLEARLVVEVIEAIVRGVTASLEPRDRDELQLWMRTVARDALLALDPQTVEDVAGSGAVMAPPFRLMLAPAIEGELVDDLDAEDADPAPEEAAITRARTRPVDPHEVDIAALTDDQLRTLGWRIADELAARGIDG